MHCNIVPASCVKGFAKHRLLEAQDIALPACGSPLATDALDTDHSSGSTLLLTPEASLIPRGVLNLSIKSFFPALVAAAAGMDFISFVTTVWGGFGLEAELFMKMLAERLAEREDISFSRARTTIRRRLQASFMNQIALNGLVYMKRIWARLVAMSC
jgi:hypothetical protein